MTTLRVGTRGSRLALTQTRWVCAQLQAAQPSLMIEEIVIKTHGDIARDRPFDETWPVGSFVTALEEALIANEVDVAVHSYKDLPSVSPDGLAIAAIPPREVVHDLLVTREPADLDGLPAGFRVGTSSPRRTALLRRVPGVEILPLRGNVPTRLDKLGKGEYDGIVCAGAGLRRLGIKPAHAIVMPPQRFVPAPAQGALAIQTRSGDGAAEVVSVLEHAETRRAVNAERAFLARIEAGCQTPLGAWATLESGGIELRGQLFSDDGVHMVEGAEAGEDPVAVGRKLADRMLADLRKLS
ncbi:MAG: hydroxymethylbilane synthase [Planctomycetota bacterium]|jgi:hydroxymethylbilane synthase